MSLFCLFLLQFNIFIQLIHDASDQRECVLLKFERWQSFLSFKLSTFFCHLTKLIQIISYSITYIIPFKICVILLLSIP